MFEDQRLFQYFNTPFVIRVQIYKIYTYIKQKVINSIRLKENAQLIYILKITP